MYDRRLDAVIAAAELGSFARAGRQLHISTPAVVKQVNTFEQEYGITLFDRSRSGVRLTAAGEGFVADALPIIDRCREILRRVRNRAESASDPIRLGVSMLRSGRRILDLWQRDARRHPQIRLELVSMPDDRQSIDDIITHLGEQVDMISTAFDAESWHGVCNTLTLAVEPLCIAVPREHRLARLPRVTLDDLQGERVRIIRRHHGGNDHARDMLERHSGIELVDIDHYDLDVSNQCAQIGDLLITKPMWDGVHPQLVNVAVDWPEPVELSYGLLYALHPEPQVRDFVERIRELNGMRGA
ncbi:LysR family transcriptional regulator [Bifidobacterium tissieri]|uniref:LysR family transcriptional regulator n=1 Tax=Bifidobacterium tissieri TaxID=1630162 RepID=A0A261FIV9_9BIFI|nr:LysR family transcriptional regulator [Bifidobacterium tissieri]OZG59100.1 LysR family transcriptional regulator [Bifidobacterium tissieri]